MWRCGLERVGGVDGRLRRMRDEEVVLGYGHGMHHLRRSRCNWEECTFNFPLICCTIHYTTPKMQDVILKVIKLQAKTLW